MVLLQGLQRCIHEAVQVGQGAAADVDRRQAPQGHAEVLSVDLPHESAETQANRSYFWPPDPLDSSPACSYYIYIL